MKIKTTAAAGTLESSDVYVTVGPNPDKALVIEIESPVMTTFGDQIRDAVKQSAKELDVTSARISLKDRGAIDCVIRARVKAALLRAAEQHYDWTMEDGRS